MVLQILLVVACKTSSETTEEDSALPSVAKIEQDSSKNFVSADRHIELMINGFEDLVYVKAGSVVRVEWNTYGYEICALEPKGSKAESGTIELKIEKDTSLLLTCVDGLVEESALLEVKTTRQISGAMAELKVNGLDQRIQAIAGDKASVHWSSMGVDNCEVFPFGAKSLSGREALSLSGDDKILSMHCRNQNYSMNDHVILQAEPVGKEIYRPKVALAANNQKGKLLVSSKERVHLKWDPQPVGTCTLEPAGLDANIGFVELGTMNEAQTLYVKCERDGGVQIVDAISIDVARPPKIKPMPSPEVRLSYDGNPGPISSPGRGKHVLSWRSKYAEKCWVSPGNYQGLEGRVEINGATSPMTYVAYCLGPDGLDQVVDILQVFAKSSVEPPQVKLYADAAKDNLVIGRRESTQVFWAAEDADECVLYPFEKTAKTGSKWMINVKHQTLVLLHCSNKGGASISGLMINVNDDLSILNAEFKVQNMKKDVASVGRGDSLQLSWDLQEWDACELQPFGISALKGQHKIRSLQQTSFMNLECRKDNGSVKFAKIVNVNNDMLEFNATGACQFVTNELCADHMAVVGLLPFESKEVGLAGWCCPVPKDVLVDKHQFVDATCPENSLVTGSRKTQSRKIRCTELNTDRYQLVDEKVANFYEQADCQCESGWEGSERKSWKSLPPSLRFVMARPRSGIFSYQTTEWYFESACTIDDQGGVLTAKAGANCKGASFKHLAYKNTADRGYVMTHPENCQADYQQWHAADRHHVKLDSFRCEVVPSHWRRLSLREL